MYITHINSFMMMMILATRVLGGVCGAVNLRGEGESIRGRWWSIGLDGSPHATCSNCNGFDTYWLVGIKLHMEGVCVNCVNFSQKGNLSCRLKSVGLFCTLVWRSINLCLMINLYLLGEVFVFLAMLASSSTLYTGQSVTRWVRVSILT